MRNIFLLALFATAACGGANDSDATDNASAAQTGEDKHLELVCPPGISVIDAWTKPARAGQPVTAAYFTLCNGDDDDALVGIASADGELARAIEIHETAMKNGAMTMRKVNELALPAGAETALRPGGAHVMFIGVTADITEQSAPSLTLNFKNADPINVPLDVRQVTAEDEHAHH